MYHPPSYNLGPIRPDLFGALPRDLQAGPPQAGGPPPQGGEAPMDMNKYLIDKVMEIKSRMGGGGPGALGAISDAMMQQQVQPEGEEIPLQPQQTMRA